MVTETGRCPGPRARTPVTVGHVRLLRRYAVRVGPAKGCCSGWVWWISRSGGAEPELAFGGIFSTPEEATEAALAAARRISAEFERRMIGAVHNAEVQA